MRVLLEAVKNGWTMDLIRGSSISECQPPEKATERYVYSDFAALIDAIREHLGAPNWAKATCVMCGNMHQPGEVWYGEDLTNMWGPLMCPECRKSAGEDTQKI